MNLLIFLIKGSQLIHAKMQNQGRKKANLIAISVSERKADRIAGVFG